MGEQVNMTTLIDDLKTRATAVRTKGKERVDKFRTTLKERKIMGQSSNPGGIMAKVETRFPRIKEIRARRPLLSGRATSPETSASSATPAPSLYPAASQPPVVTDNLKTESRLY